MGAAAARPNLFRLMSSERLADRARHPEVGEARSRAYQVLLDTIVAGQRAGTVRAGDPSHLALGHYAIVRGIVSLILDGVLADRLRERGGAVGLARLAAEQIWSGLEPRRSP